MLDRVETAVSGRARKRSSLLRGALACAALLCAGLIVAGCGSSSSSSSSTAAAKPPLTKAQFLAQGNAICTQGNKNLEGFIKGPFKSEIQRQIDAIRALRAPTADQANIKRIFDLAQAELDRVTSNPKAVESSSVSPFKEFSTAAHAYGLTVCASESNG
jgi:hypothetical protein